MLKKLYAPWRTAYHNNKKNQCVFCDHLKDQKDRENFILKRFANCFVMLNLYPYNAGHILIIPNEHAADLNQLSKEARAEIMEAANLSSIILKEKLKCDGINIGLNMGSYSGGSIPQHLHLHVVPRWSNDTNFLVTTDDTKQISFDLNEIYNKLQKYF